MQLLYTLTAYPPSTGGAQLHAHLLAQVLQQHHHIKVVSLWDRNRTDWLLGTTLRVPPEAFHYNVEGIDVLRLGLPLPRRLSLLPYVAGYYPFMKFAIPPIARCLKETFAPYVEKVDLVHNFRIGREPFSYASLELARERGVPFVFTPFHHPRWIGWRYQAYVELYKLADLVFCLTNPEKETLIGLGVREERISVTGTGPVLAEHTEPEAFLERHGINGPCILFLGQHYAYKGYSQVLEAAEAVWRRVPEAHFLFIGPPVGQSEQKFAAKPDRRIHRLGKVDLQEKSDALAACTLLCVPSTQESFGGVYTEAWFFGKPVIGGNITAVSDVIDDGNNGYLVNQTSSDIADKILDLLCNPERAKAMGEKGKKKLEDRYTWQRLAELTLSAYQTVL